MTTNLDVATTKTETAKLLAIAENIISKSPVEQEEWLQALGQSLTTWGDVVDFSIARESEILYWVHRVWEAKDPSDRLHPSAKLLWKSDFFVWANTFIKRRGHEQSTEAIANKIRVHLNWLSPEATIVLPATVFIQARDAGGKPVEDPTDKDWVEVEPDLDLVDYSKLLVVQATAKERDLSCETWSAVFDPAKTVADVQATMRNDGNGNGNGDDKFRFFFEDGIIYARENGYVEGIASLLAEEEVSPLFLAGVGHLLKAVGIKDTPILDEEQAMKIDAPAWVAGEELVVASNSGYRVAVFSKAEAEEILGVLEGFVNEA